MTIVGSRLSCVNGPRVKLNEIARSETLSWNFCDRGNDSSNCNRHLLILPVGLRGLEKWCNKTLFLKLETIPPI